MKNAIYLLLVFFVISFVACKDDDEATTDLTSQEMAEVVANSLSASTGGIAQQTGSSVGELSKVDFENLKKDLQKEQIVFLDTTIVISSLENSVITYNYTLDYSFSYQFISLNPISLGIDIHYKMNGTYQTKRMTSDDNTEANFSILVNDFLVENYTLTGTYLRKGSQTSKVGNKNSFTSILTINITEMNINKLTGLINSGKATVTFTGSTTGGRTFSFSGSIDFIGENKAKLTVGNSVFEINLQTGDVV